ncbi:hypothetical protein ACFL3T_05430, partial [Patescibacteria group bacterium]
YLWANFGDPLLFLKQQSHWGREMVFNIFWRYYDALNIALRFDDPMRLIEFGSVTFMVILIVLMIIKKLRPSYIIWSIVLLLIPMMQNMWLSINRFILVIFPTLIILSYFGNKYINYILYGCFGSLLIFHTVLFINQSWVG